LGMAEEQPSTRCNRLHQQLLGLSHLSAGKIKQHIATEDNIEARLYLDRCFTGRWLGPFQQRPALEAHHAPDFWPDLHEILSITADHLEGAAQVEVTQAKRP